MEVCPTPTLGPTSRNRLGNPATVALRLLIMPSDQTSASDRPSRPQIFFAIGRSVTWKPVASTIVSAGRSAPAVGTIGGGRASAVAAGTRPGVGAAAAGE